MLTILPFLILSVTSHTMGSKEKFAMEERVMPNTEVTKLSTSNSLRAPCNALFPSKPRMLLMRALKSVFNTIWVASPFTVLVADLMAFKKVGSNKLPTVNCVFGISKPERLSHNSGILSAKDSAIVKMSLRLNSSM